MATDRFLFTTAGVRMPRIVYGTAWKGEETDRWVRTALERGFRGIDTACQPKHYHEPGVGAGIAASLGRGLSREDIYLQTKFTSLSGQDPERVPYDPAAPAAEQVAQSFAASQRNLRTPVIDCLVLHGPTRDPTVWPAMEALVDAGAVRQLGISNCYALATLRALYEHARVKPVVVQNRFHAETGYDRSIRAYCRKHGMVYQSFWTLTANPNVLTHRTVRAIAARHERTPAQVLFRYLTQIDVVPLTGTRSEPHMREDLAIFEFELDARECREMEQLL